MKPAPPPPLLLGGHDSDRDRCSAERRKGEWANPSKSCLLVPFPKPLPKYGRSSEHTQKFVSGVVRSQIAGRPVRLAITRRLMQLHLQVSARGTLDRGRHE